MCTTNLSAIVSYTWSKLLGNTTDVTTGSLNANGYPGVQNFYRYDLERSVQPTDIPHSVVGKLNYTLPFGHGQRKFLLGHSSIQTTERYLGSEQDFAVAVDDNLGL